MKQTKTVEPATSGTNAHPESTIPDPNPSRMCKTMPAKIKFKVTLFFTEEWRVVVVIDASTLEAAKKKAESLAARLKELGENPDI